MKQINYVFSEGFEVFSLTGHTGNNSTIVSSPQPLPYYVKTKVVLNVCYEREMDKICT